MTFIAVKFYNAMFKKIKPLSSSYLQSALFPDFYILINGTTIQQLSKFKISALSPMCPFFSSSITCQLADSVSSTSKISIASSPSFPFSHYKLQSSPRLTNQNFCSHYLTGLHVLCHQKIDFLHIWLILHQMPAQTSLMTHMIFLTQPNTFI